MRILVINAYCQCLDRLTRRAATCLQGIRRPIVLDSDLVQPVDGSYAQRP